MNQAIPASPLTARRSGALTGRVRVPGDKSISLRSLILGALAVGETRITGMLEGEDAISTANAMKALGATVERTGERAWSVRGVGVGGFAEPSAALDFGNSGTGCRLAMGAVAGCPITATFDGDASLRTRPMRRILDPLERMGARTLEIRRGRPPAGDAAGRPRPDADRIRGAGAVGAAQVGGAAGGPGRARRHHRDREGSDPRPHREDAQAFRRQRTRDRRSASTAAASRCKASRSWKAAPVVVPADPSSAAFPLVAALIVPGSEIVLEGVMLNPLRTGF